MSTRRTIPVILLAASLLGVAGALGHGSAKHVMGTATAVETGRLDVETRDGDEVTLELHGETKYRDEAGVPAEPGELRIGDRVVVDFHLEGETKVADEVRFAHPDGREERP